MFVYVIHVRCFFRRVLKIRISRKITTKFPFGLGLCNVATGFKGLDLIVCTCRRQGKLIFFSRRIFCRVGMILCDQYGNVTKNKLTNTQICINPECILYKHTIKQFHPAISSPVSSWTHLLNFTVIGHQAPFQYKDCLSMYGISDAALSL